MTIQPPKGGGIGGGSPEQRGGPLGPRVPLQPDIHGPLSAPISPAEDLASRRGRSLVRDAATLPPGVSLPGVRFPNRNQDSPNAILSGQPQLRDNRNGAPKPMPEGVDVEVRTASDGPEQKVNLDKSTDTTPLPEAVHGQTDVHEVRLEGEPAKHPVSARETEGVTLNSSENLSNKSYPLLPEWMEGYKWANDNYPQINLAIHIEAANSFLKSIQAKEVDWMHVSQSGFSDEQLGEIKTMLNDRHRAFGIEKYPKEHIKVGEREDKVMIQDQTLQDIWTNMIQGVGFTFFDFAGGWDPQNNPEQQRIVDNQEPLNLTEADNQFITNFFADETNAGKVAQLASLYAAADAALRLPDTMTLAARRKAEFNRRRTALPRHEMQREKISGTGLSVPYIGLIRRAVGRQIEETASNLKIPETKTADFVDNVIRMSN